MKKAYIIIEVGKHTTIARRFDEDKPITIFGMKYTIEEIECEGWKWHLEYLSYKPEGSWRS